jgi:HEAT repeat protein
VDALGSFSELSAVKKLTVLVADSGDRMLRQRAIRALGLTGSTSATDPLLQALKDAASDSERILVVDALTGLRSQKAVAPLQTLLKNAADPLLRTRIVIALGAIEDGSTYPTLIEMLNDTVPAVRYFAVRSLHRQKKREAVIPISQLSLEIARHLDNHSIPDLLAEPVPVLAELSFQVAALEAITDLNASRGIQALLEAASPRPIPRDSATALKIAEGVYRQRRAALFGLGYTKSREAARLLLGENGIRDPDFRLRAVAARSLGVLGFPDAVEILINFLGDPAAEVRWTSATVLGRLRDKNAVKPLVMRLSDENAEVRRQAALSLGFLGDPLACDELKRLKTEDGNENVRTAAAYSIRLLQNHQ